MGKRQIEKEFDRLYVGQNQKLLVENYYKKKKRFNTEFENLIIFSDEK